MNPSSLDRQVQHVEEALRLRPDVVVMDLHMPEMNGVEATRRLSREAPEIAVLVLTMVEGDASVTAALGAGARGYLLKGADRAEIARALDVVGHGGVYFPAALAGRVPLLLGGRGGDDGHPFPHLTPREQEVLELVANGCRTPRSPRACTCRRRQCATS